MTFDDVFNSDCEIVQDDRSVALLNTEYFGDPSGPFRSYVLTPTQTYGCSDTDPQLYDRLEKVL